MRTRVLAFISKMSSRFFYELLPVALASVAGAMLVNNINRPISPSVVVQAPAPAADAVLQTLRDEHELVVDYLKRDAEAKRPDADKVRAIEPPYAPPPPESRPAKARLAVESKAWPLPPPRPAPEAVPGEPLLLGANPTVTSPASTSAPPPDGWPAGWPIRRPHVARAVRDFVVNVALLPGRALEAGLPDDWPRPPLPPLESSLTSSHPN